MSKNKNALNSDVAMFIASILGVYMGYAWSEKLFDMTRVVGFGNAFIPLMVKNIDDMLEKIN